jgi:hypothetical protein
MAKRWLSLVSSLVTSLEEGATVKLLDCSYRKSEQQHHIYGASLTIALHHGQNSDTPSIGQG